MSALTFDALSWGELAAARLHPDWLARIWEEDDQSLLLIDHTGGELVRIVTPTIGDGPFHLVVPDETAAAWAELPRHLYAWRVGAELWIGDELTLRLPEDRPWQSTLIWDREATGQDEQLISRHLALLGDWLLARAPEGSLAGLLPDLLISGSLTKSQADRPDLPVHARLFRWRAANILDDLIPALVEGDLATAESAVNRLAGLGAGRPPAGDWFLLGFMAGVQLWPEFLTEGSGLRRKTLLQRLARSVMERTSVLGQGVLRAALEERWEGRWHRLYDAITATGPYPDKLRARIEQEAATWLEQDEAVASAGLAGLVTPFLWYQRFLS